MAPISRREFWIQTLASSALLASSAGLVNAIDEAKPDVKPTTKKGGPKVEVVFCLDTTGSMGGLIEGAKQKIWAISNQIASGKPVPELKIGLVGYRDRKDTYITKVFDLTDDLDAVHGNLRGFQAAGGGDGPESVNEALADSVNKINWDKDPKTLKIIFLVGDAPPHMDYNETRYPDICQSAVKKGLIINTIQCGGDANCTKYWKEICTKSEGSYVQIAQNGGVVATIATPFDKDLAKINGQLAEKTLVYGNRRRQEEGKAKQEAARELAPAAAADRAAFAGKSGKVAAYDLIDALQKGNVKLKDLKKEELPKELQELKPEARDKYIKKLDEERKALQKQAVELDKKRSEFIRKKQAETGGKDKSGFDGQVLEILRKQAKKHKIDY